MAAVTGKLSFIIYKKTRCVQRKNENFRENERNIACGSYFWDVVGRTAAFSSVIDQYQKKNHPGDEVVCSADRNGNYSPLASAMAVSIAFILPVAVET